MPRVKNLKSNTMNQKIYLSVIVIFTAFILSCSNSGEILHKNISGNANELIVVIPDELWIDLPGSLVKETLGQVQLALPQDEPLFDLVNVPPSGFKSIFRSARNVLQLNISASVSEPGIDFKDDVWAYPQATVLISAKNAEQFEKVYSENSERIMSYFLAAEKERLTMNYDKYYEKGVYNVLDKEYGITMKVPPGFVIADRKKDFIWYKYETPEISQGIVVYSLPYNSDSIFTANVQVALRDSVFKENVPGPLKGSYMSTEKRVIQLHNYLEHNGNYASEMRGLWRLENDYMGGPFISLAELDATNQRVVVAYGYVYAPSKDKRNLIRQVEAMVYSLKFNDQEKNNKLNSQIKMGN